MKVRCSQHLMRILGQFSLHFVEVWPCQASQSELRPQPRLSRASAAAVRTLGSKLPPNNLSKISSKRHHPSQCFSRLSSYPHQTNPTRDSYILRLREVLSGARSADRACSHSAHIPATDGAVACCTVRMTLMPWLVQKVQKEPTFTVGEHRIPEFWTGES